MDLLEKPSLPLWPQAPNPPKDRRKVVQFLKPYLESKKEHHRKKVRSAVGSCPMAVPTNPKNETGLHGAETLIPP